MISVSQSAVYLCSSRRTPPLKVYFKVFTSRSCSGIKSATSILPHVVRKYKTHPLFLCIQRRYNNIFHLFVIQPSCRKSELTAFSDVCPYVTRSGTLRTSRRIVPLCVRCVRHGFRSVPPHRGNISRSPHIGAFPRKRGEFPCRAALSFRL